MDSIISIFRGLGPLTAVVAFVLLLAVIYTHWAGQKVDDALSPDLGLEDPLPDRIYNSRWVGNEGVEFKPDAWGLSLAEQARLQTAMTPERLSASMGVGMASVSNASQESWLRFQTQRNHMAADSLADWATKPHVNPHRDALIDRINDVEREVMAQQPVLPFPVSLIGHGVHVPPPVPMPSLIALPVVDMANLGARA